MIGGSLLVGRREHSRNKRHFSFASDKKHYVNYTSLHVSLGQAILYPDVLSQTDEGGIEKLPANPLALKLGQYEEQSDVVAVAESAHADNVPVYPRDQGKTAPLGQRAEVTRKNKSRPSGK